MVQRDAHITVESSMHSDAEYLGKLMKRISQVVFLLQITYLAGCGVTTQVTCDLEYRNIGSIAETTLQQYGIGVLTPSIVTGRETDKQVVGEVLSDGLRSRLGTMTVVSLVEFLNLINVAGLAEIYAASLEMYDESGIIPRASIGRLGEAANVRYLAKLSLANFEQTQVERFGIAGIRVLSTNRTRIRLFLEIWDSDDGQIVWYANEELSMASERAAEDELSIRGAATRAIGEMLNVLLTRTGERSYDEATDLACELES